MKKCFESSLPNLQHHDVFFVDVSLLLVPAVSITSGGDGSSGSRELLYRSPSYRFIFVLD